MIYCSKYLCGIALCISGALGAAAAVDPNPMLGMRVSTGTTPTIDGKISGGEWDDAAKLPPFIMVESSMARWDKLNDVMLKYDSENLYIGFRTYMSIDMNLDPQIPDNLAMMQVESFDIRLMEKSHPQWKRFMVERGGQKLDMRFRGHIHDNPADWNPEWEYKCSLTPMDFAMWSIWEGEIAIPWETLEVPPPGDRAQLSAMFIRYLGTAGNAEGCRTASWNLAASDTDLIFDANYGALVFEPDKPVFRCDSIETYTRCQAGITGTMVGPGAENGGKVNSAVWDRSNSKRFFDTADVPFASAVVDWSKNIRIRQAENGSGRIYVLDSENDPVCKYPFLNTILPGFYSDALWDSMRDIVAFCGESLEGFNDGDIIHFYLADSEGNEYAAEDVEAGNLLKGFDYHLDSSMIPAGSTFTAGAALVRNGETMYESIFSIEKDAPLWQGTADRYRVTTPPAGWEKVVLTEDNGVYNVAIRDHAYIFSDGLMPSSVMLRGEEFSRGEWSFVAETASGTQDFVCKDFILTSEDGRGVTFTGAWEAAELMLYADIRVEFDGLAWYDCTVVPKKEAVEVRHIAIKCPLEREYLRYMRGYAHSTYSSVSRYALIGDAATDRNIVIPEIPVKGGISFNGWNFENTFNEFYWISGDDRGVLWVLPSAENTAITEKFNKVTDNGEEFCFELELINTPVTFAGPVRYQFGTVLTPARKAPNPAGLRRVGQFCWGLEYDVEHQRSIIYDSNVIDKESIGKRFFHPGTPTFELDSNFIFGDMIASWIMKDVQDGNFMPDDKTRAEIGREARGIRNGDHGKPILWYDMLATAHRPARDEWRSGPYTDMLGDVPVSITCAASAWPDAYLYGIQERIKDGVAGFYLDLSGWKTCNNRRHGCGYYDAAGELQASVPFLAQREFMLTMQKMMKDNDTDSVIVYHGATPMNIWTDFHIDGESWQYAQNYDTLSPEYYQLLMMSREMSGSTPCFYSVLLYRHVPGCQKSDVTQEDTLGLALVHGQHCYNLHDIEVYGNYITTKPLLDFGVDDEDSVWIPFWRNPRSRYPETSLAVSSWKKGERELMIVYNFSTEKSEILDLGCETVCDRLKGMGEISGSLEVGPRELFILETTEAVPKLLKTVSAPSL